MDHANKERIVISATRIIVHENYEMVYDGLLNDIALLEIPVFEYTSCIKPICLPASIEDRFEGVDATGNWSIFNYCPPSINLLYTFNPSALGLGVSYQDPETNRTFFESIVQKASLLTVNPPSTCHQVWFKDKSRFSSFPEEVLCVDNSLQAVCMGDSGGPLFVEVFITF